MTEEEKLNYPTPTELNEARRRAREKLADEIVAREMGVDGEGPPRRGSTLRDERMVQITLELPEHTAELVIDGKRFQHGNTYTVTESVYQVMREIIYRGYNHQAEIEGKDKLSAYRKEKNLNFNSGNASALIAAQRRMLHG